MSIGTEIVVRPFEVGDLDGVLELQRIALGQGGAPRTEEFWRWKHELNPFGRSPAWVAVSGTRIVGLRVFLRWRWQAADQSLEAVRAVDTATHPDCRRQGIFSTLTRHALGRLTDEGCELVFNTPNRRSGGGYRKLGWSAALRPTMYVLPVRPLRMAGAAIRRDPSRSAADLTSLPPVDELLQWSQLDGLLSEYDRNWESKLHTPRDLAYLRWRYAQIPGFDYRSVWASDGDHQLALVFRTRLRRSMRELLVSEMLGTGSRHGQLLLLRALLDRIRREIDIDYIAASTPPRSNEATALRSAGFRRVPGGPTLMVRGLGARRSTSDSFAGECWQLSIGDLEIF